MHKPTWDTSVIRQLQSYVKIQVLFILVAILIFTPFTHVKKKKRPVVERPTLVRINSFSASYLLSCGWMFCKAVRITTKKPRNGVPICIINLTEMYGEIEKFHNIPQTLIKFQIKHFITRYYYIICFINWVDDVN